MIINLKDNPESYQQYLSDNSWFFLREDYFTCDDEQFEELWKLNELFEVHEVRLFGKYIKIPRKQGLFSNENISYKFSGCVVESQRIPDNSVLKECERIVNDIDMYNAFFSTGIKMGKIT